MALTQDQINRRASAENTYKAALDAYNTKLAACNVSLAYVAQRRDAALDCDARRAQYDLGWRKDQACGNRTQLYNLWNEAQLAQDRCQAELLTANNLVVSTKKALEQVIAQIDLEIQQAQKALELDPSYQKQIADQKLREDEQKALQRERQTRNVLTFLGVVVLIIGLVYIFRSGAVKNIAS